MMKKLLITITVIFVGGFVLIRVLMTSEKNLCNNVVVSENIDQVVFIPFKSNHIYGSGVVLSGCLQSGTLESEMKTIINGKETRIKGNIEAQGNSYHSIPSSDKQAVGILLEGLDEEDKKVTEEMIKNKEKLIFTE